MVAVMTKDVGRVASPKRLSSQATEPAREFVVKRWLVTVFGFGTHAYVAKTRGRALADAWRSGAFDHIPFGDFLRRARCRRDQTTPPRWGDQITVSGRAAFFLDNNPQYVQFVWPGSDRVLSSHPYDVLPVEYRPWTYRDRDSDGSGAADETRNAAKPAGRERGPKASPEPSSPSTKQVKG